MSANFRRKKNLADKKPNEVLFEKEVERENRLHKKQYITDYLGCGIEETSQGFLILRYNEDGSTFFEKEEFGSFYFELFVRKYFSRFVYPNLTPVQARVLDFIVDRTIGWGKAKEKIMFSCFINGYENYTLGTKLSLKSIQDSLKFLHLNNIIFIEGENSKTKTYSINFKGLNLFLPKIRKEFIMKDRKNIEVLIKNKEIRDSKKSQDLLSSSRFNSEKYQKDLLGDSRSDDEDLLRRSRKKNTNIKKHKSNANPSDLHCEVSIKEKIEQALNSSKKRKEKKLSGKVTVLKIQELWNDSVKTEFKDFPHLNWTKKEYGMVKHFLTSGAFSEISEYKEFFEFVCTQWWVIKGQHFKNLNKVLLDKGSSAIDVPEVPMIGFVMVYKKNILNAYAKNKSLLLSPKDRQLQNFQRQGYTIEQAEEKMKEKEMAKQQANKRKELAEAPKIQKQKSLQISAKPKAAIQEPLHNPKTVEEFVVPVFLTDGTIPTCEDPESLELRSWVLAIAKAHEKNAQKVFEDAVMFGTDYVLQSGMFLRKAGTSLTSKGLK